MKIRSRSSQRGANDFTAPAFGVEVEQQPESSKAQVPASAQSAHRRRLPGSACNSDPRLRLGEGGSASEQAGERAGEHSQRGTGCSQPSLRWQDMGLIHEPNFLTKDQLTLLLPARLARGSRDDA